MQCHPSASYMLCILWENTAGQSGCCRQIDYETLSGLDRHSCRPSSLPPSWQFALSRLQCQIAGPANQKQVLASNMTVVTHLEILGQLKLLMAIVAGHHLSELHTLCHSQRVHLHILRKNLTDRVSLSKNRIKKFANHIGVTGSVW